MKIEKSLEEEKQDPLLMEEEETVEISQNRFLAKIPAL